MNNIFEINRLGSLFQKEMKEYVHKYAASTLTIICCYLGYWVICMAFGRQAQAEERFYFFAFAVVWYILLLPFKLYGDVNDKKLGPNYALLPASTTEKFSSMMISSVVVYPALFTIVMLLFDGLLSVLSFGRTFTGTMFTAEFFSWDNIKNYFDILLLQSVFMYGNLLFRKHKISKTILGMISVNMVLVMLLVVVSYLVFNSGNIAFDGMNITIGGEVFDELEGYKHFTMKAFEVFAYVYTIGFPIVFWVLSFFRIKKMQYK